MTARERHYRLGRLLLDRREFLTAMGAIGSTAAIAALPGCGGATADATDAGGATQTYKVTGSVQLPAGFSLTPGQLSLVSGASVATPAANGEFDASVYTTEPSLAVLTDKSSNSVFLGFVDPQSGSNILGATSTAVALLYFAIGGPTVLPSDKREILQLLEGDAVIPSLASMITARVAVEPYAIQEGDAQITAALLAAYTALTANVLAAATKVPMAREVTGADATASVPPLELVQPTGQQSGVEVLQPADSVGVLSINHFRRRAQMYIYRVGEVSTAGVATNYPSTVAVGNRADISATTALGLFTTLDNLFSGTTAFTPVTSPAQPLALQPNASQTSFEVVVLGASGNANPGFFGATRYAAVAPDWITNVGNLNLFTAIGDMALGFVLELWGLRFVITDAAPIQAVLDGLAGLQATVPSVANLLARARAGKYSEAIADVIELAANSDIVSSTIKLALKPYIIQLEHEVAVGATGTISSRLMSSAFRLISAAFTPVAMTMGLGDLAAIAYDLSNSNPGDLWTVSLVVPTISLSPATAMVTAGGRQTFTVRLPTGTTGNFVFDWTQTSPYGTLSASNGTVGNSLETNDASITVDLVTTPSDTQPITVSVTAFEVDSGGNKTQFGLATAKVTLTQGTVGNCSPLGPFEKIYPDGRFTWISMFTFPQVSGATHYAFSGYITGTVILADPNQSVPVIDMGTHTDPTYSTWVPYQSAEGTGAGLAIYNVGGGIMGIVAYPAADPVDYKYSGDGDSALQKQGATDALSGSQSVVAT